MYVFTAIVFIGPCFLLCSAWRHISKKNIAMETASWRLVSLKVSLHVALFATATSALLLVSWFRNGGSPYGMWPSPGMWKHLGPVSGWSGILSIALALIGSGKGRWFVLGSALAVFLAKALLFAIEMD